MLVCLDLVKRDMLSVLCSCDNHSVESDTKVSVAAVYFSVA